MKAQTNPISEAPTQGGPTSPGADPPVSAAPAGTAASGDSDTAELTIRYVQSQLDMATKAYDSLDQKAALLPAFLAGAAGLLLAGKDLDRLTAILLVPAVLVGMRAGWLAIEALRTRSLAAGPDPADVVAKMHRPLAEFSPALAKVIADAVTDRRKVAKEKADAFNDAIRWTALTLLLVASARLAGGILVTDQSEAGPSTPPTAAPSASPSATPSATPSTTPSVTPSEAPSPSAAPAATGPATSENGPTAQPLFEMAYEERSVDAPPPRAPSAMESNAKGAATPSEPLSFAMGHEVRRLFGATTSTQQNIIETLLREKPEPPNILRAASTRRSTATRHE